MTFSFPFISNFLCYAYFVVTISAICVVPLWSERLQPLVVYGKTSTSRPQSKDKSIITSLAAWQVPRSWFKHFYLLSTAIGILNCIRCLQLPTYSCLNVFLYVTHSIRRTLETCCLERPSGSSMWVGHYLIGLTFYTFTNLAMILASQKDAAQMRSDHSGGLIWTFICIIIYFCSQAAQHDVHRRLANYRAKCSPGQYVNPSGGLFRYFVAPHYTAEIMIYLSLAFLNGAEVCLYLVALWSALTLSVSARETDVWGRKQFKDWGNRWLVMPGF